MVFKAQNKRALICVSEIPIARCVPNMTHKKRTPPREKYAEVDSGVLKKIVPMMIAWNM